MRTPTEDGLWLLLMSLGIAACPSADTDSGGGSGTDTTTQTSSGNGEEGSTSGPGGSATDTGTGMTSNVGDSTSSEASGSDSGDSGAACSISSIPPICDAAAERWDTCLYGGDGLVTQMYAEGCACRLDLAGMLYGAECIAALEDYYACLSETDCMVLVQQVHCDAEFGPIFDACPGLSPQ